MKKIILIGVVLAIVIIGASFGYEYLSEKTEIPAPEAPNQEEKIPAPDFVMLDIDGNEINFSEFKGKPVVINFWATWCGPCKREMPFFDEAYKEFGDEIEFIMLNVPEGDTIEGAKEFSKENGYTFPLYFDADFSGARIYGITSFPTTVFIDKEGNVSAGYIGALNRDTIFQNLESIR